MGAQKHGSKGGFLHLFDWNAKSRKKLFSSKLESPEQPKQTKRTDGNMPVTRFNTMEEDEMISDYSCATSVTDEDGYGTKAPGVVARLMGLDSLPNLNFSDTYSNPSFDSQSLGDSAAPYVWKNPEFDSISRAIEKFQTEKLPPKSAKSIPITRHKLLSPIKNSGFVSSSNPARIMEAASKIPLIGSSSVPLKVKVSREKIESSTRKPKILEAPRRPLVSNTGKNLKGQPSLEPKKSISLALQAKANVQKREGLNHRAQSVKTQTSTERNSQKVHVSSSVLKPNNQKQNSLVDRGKSTPKLSSSTIGSQTRKPVSQKSSSKIIENSRTSHKKEPYSTRRKQSMEESDHNHAEKNIIRDRSYKSNKSDVVSFTFTAPINRNKNVLDLVSNASNSSSLSYNVIGGDALSTLLDQKLRELTGNPASVSQDSSYDPLQLMKKHQNPDQITRDDSSYGFSTNDPLELMKKHHKLDLGRSRFNGDDSSYGYSSNDPQEFAMKHYKLDQCAEVILECSSSDYEYRKYLHGRQPSPSSVLEPSFITESCNSSDTANNYIPNSTSVQGQELISASFSRNPSPMDIDTELLDSASSITTLAKWEPEYVKEVLSDIQTMFADFTIGKTRKIVNPRVFDRLESGRPNQEVVKLRRELVFNCVSECMETRCRVWAKGLVSVRRPDRLAEEVYREILGWEDMKDCMVDELVDKDMSGEGYKRWLDFDVEAFEIGVEIESRLLDSLIDEVVDDILGL